MPEPFRRSPLHHRHAIEAPGAVRLAERPFLGKWVLRGKPDVVGTAVRGVAELDLPAACRATRSGATAILWIGPDEHWLISHPPLEGEGRPEGPGWGEAAGSEGAEMLSPPPGAQGAPTSPLQGEVGAPVTGPANLSHPPLEGEGRAAGPGWGDAARGEGAERSPVAILASRLAGTRHQLADVSAYYTAIELAGPRARELLMKLTTLDLHPRAFVEGQVAGSMFGHAQGYLWLTTDTPDGPAFLLFVRRTMADYLWCLMAEAGREWGLPGQEPLAGETWRLAR